MTVIFQLFLNFSQIPFLYPKYVLLSALYSFYNFFLIINWWVPESKVVLNHTCNKWSSHNFLFRTLKTLCLDTWESTLAVFHQFGYQNSDCIAQESLTCTFIPNKTIKKVPIKGTLCNWTSWGNKNTFFFMRNSYTLEPNCKGLHFNSFNSYYWGGKE